MESSSSPSPTKHIRPRVRRRGVGANRSSGEIKKIANQTAGGGGGHGKKDEEDLDAMLERTRKLLEGGGNSSSIENKKNDDGLTETKATAAAAKNVNQKKKSAAASDGSDSSRSSGILKKNPKYSKGSNNEKKKSDFSSTVIISSPPPDATVDMSGNSTVLAVGGTVNKKQQSPSIISTDTTMEPSMIISSPHDGIENPMMKEEEITTPQAEINKPFLKDLVVEKNPSIPNTATATVNTSTAVEGYSPSTTTAETTKQNKNKSIQTKQVKRKPSSSDKKAATPPLPPGTIRSLSELVSTAAKLTAEAAQSSPTQDTQNSTSPSVDDINNEEKSQDVNKNEIETDLEFTCMTNDEYEETMKLATSLGMIAVDEDDDIDDDNEEVKDENDDDDDTNPNKIKSQNNDEEEDEDSSWNSDPEYDTDPNKSDNDDIDDDSILGFFSTKLDDEDVEPEPEESPFLKLWSALSSWVTPESVTLLQEWKKELEEEEESEQKEDLLPFDPRSLSNSSRTLRPPFDTSDIGASRCAGLMSMMKLNLPRSLSELLKLYNVTATVEKGYVQRCAEERLSNLLRTFDYTKPMVKLDGKLWKVLTFVLLEIVFLPCWFLMSSSSSLESGEEKEDLKLPLSVESIGMTLEEYRYLTNSALTSLSLGSGE